MHCFLNNIMANNIINVPLILLNVKSYDISSTYFFFRLINDMTRRTTKLSISNTRKSTFALAISRMRIADARPTFLSSLSRLLNAALGTVLLNTASHPLGNVLMRFAKIIVALTTCSIHHYEATRNRSIIF